MAVRRKRIDMSMAVAAIRVQVGELTASLAELNDGLAALAGQIGRFGQLSHALGGGAPVPALLPHMHVTPAAPPPANPGIAGPHSLSPAEVAQREALMAQFPRRNRPDIERELAEGGDA